MKDAGKVEVGLRGVPELQAVPLPPSDPRLVDRIGSEIRHSGPMTFARFMELALYDPESGYYTAPDDATAELGASAGPGRRGDFLTAPESHPIFGWAIARHLEAVWDRLGRPGRFVIREHGAGNGALAASILDGLRRSASNLLDVVRYQAIDASPPRLDALRAGLAAAGLDRHLEPADQGPAAGAVLANELLDALPVHRVEGVDGGALLERFVDLAPSSVDQSRPFTTVLGPPSTTALAARLAAERISVEPGQPAEICLALDGWVAEATAPLERGELLLIDYGAPAAELYAPA